MTLAGLLVDTLIIVLLAVTIGYCWVLNRRIKILQDSKSELALLLRHFDESTQRASASIIGLQSASKKIGENIQSRIDKANYLIDDLSFMIDRGNKLANQIEASFAVNRARTRVMAEEPPEAPEELPEPPPVKAAAPPAREKTMASLEAVLSRVVGRRKAPEAEEALPQGRSATRSRSEQELLEMLRSGLKG